jgi:hypothetical protein
MSWRCWTRWPSPSPFTRPRRGAVCGPTAQLCATSTSERDGACGAERARALGRASRLLDSGLSSPRRTLDAFLAYNFGRLPPDELAAFSVLNTLLRDEVEVRANKAINGPPWERHPCSATCAAPPCPYQLDAPCPPCRTEGLNALSGGLVTPFYQASSREFAPFCWPLLAGLRSLPPHADQAPCTRTSAYMHQKASYYYTCILCIACRHDGLANSEYLYKVGQLARAGAARPMGRHAGPTAPPGGCVATEPVLSACHLPAPQQITLRAPLHGCTRATQVQLLSGARQGAGNVSSTAVVKVRPTPAAAAAYALQRPGYPFGHLGEHVNCCSRSQAERVFRSRALCRVTFPTDGARGRHADQHTGRAHSQWRQG